MDIKKLVRAGLQVQDMDEDLMGSRIRNARVHVGLTPTVWVLPKALMKALAFTGWLRCADGRELA